MRDDPAAANTSAGETPVANTSAADAAATDAAARPPGQEQPGAEGQQPTAPTVLDLDVAKLTDVGRARPHNEDYVDFRIPPDSRELARKGSLFVVADGMGGHQAGEVASRGAVETAIEHYYGDAGRDVPTSLVRAFRAANQRIYEQSQADPSKAGMGTTLVAAAILGRRVYVANVGDSRAYLINRQGIVQITEDHSWVEEQVRAGLLTEEQARKHPQRNLVTRAMGSKPSVEVDLFEGEIATGDKLLLCSDGLTGRVADAEIAAIVQQYPVEEAARRLVAEANERGGNDNITALIVAAQAELPTVKAPVIPAPEQKAARRVPLIPILTALAAVVVIAVAAFWAWNAGIIGGAVDTPTPSATATSTAPAPTATEAEIVPTAEAASPTASPTLEPTSTLAAAPSATAEAPTATETALPSDTPAASDTPTASPTATDTATATAENTPAVTGTPELPPAPLTLLQPVSGAILTDTVTFSWQASRPLAAGEGFQFLIGRENEEGSFLYESLPQQEDNIEINLNNILPEGEQGNHFVWSVCIVSTESGERLTEVASPRSFTYGPDGGP